MAIPYKNILKVVLVTLIFLWGYKAFLYASSGDIVAEKIIQTNATRFQSAHSEEYLNISAAISTRIGIGYSEASWANLTNSFYSQRESIWETIEEKSQIRQQMLTQNMLIIGEYLNLSRTDIKSLLNWSSDRKKTLESFINQLELRQKNSQISLESLQNQKDRLLAYLETLDGAIETTKWNMEREFSAGKPQETLETVDNYFELRDLYTITFTDIVFINQFIKQHDFLIRYNIWLLNTLKTNKQAIIDQSYVVIPSTWSEYLRPLELLFDESEVEID